MRLGNPPCSSACGCPLLGMASAFGAMKRACWDSWESAVLGQNLAGSRLEPDFGNSRASRPRIKGAFCDYWETAVFGQILAGSLLEPDVGNWPASGPQIKAPSKTIGKRPVCGQILAGSLLEPDFGNLAAAGPQLKTPSKTIGKRPVLGQILAGSLLEPDFGNLAASGPQVKAPSKTIGKRPFSAKSWPGAFWSQILAVGRRLGASGKLLGSVWEPSKTAGNVRAPASSARRPKNTKAQAFFTERFSQSDASSRTPFLVTLKLNFAFLKLGKSFWQPETLKGSS